MASESDASSRFRSVSDKLESAIIPSLSKVARKLSARGLIARATYDKISKDRNDADAATNAANLIRELQSALENVDDPEQYLKNICDALREVKEKLITDIANKLIPVTQKDTSKAAGVEDSGPSKEANFEGIDSPDGPTKTVKPPEWTDNPKIYIKKDALFTDDLTKDIKFLLMPATPAEEEQFLLYLEPKDESSDKYIKTSVGNITLYIGKYGKTPVIVAMTAPAKDRQGPNQAGIVATKILNKIKSIKYVVAVGVCFGIYRKKQDLGDVVISSIICDFVCKREGTTVHPRGSQDGVGREILNIFTPPRDFPMPHNNKVHVGPVISQPDLIDNATVKASLVNKREDAVGGEMEGAAINAAVKENELPATCIVIKGIGDWADGTKEGSKEWKPYAARAAAYYVKTALNEYSSDAAAISKESTMEKKGSDAVVDTVSVSKQDTSKADDVVDYDSPDGSAPTGSPTSTFNEKGTGMSSSMKQDGPGNETGTATPSAAASTILPQATPAHTVSSGIDAKIASKVLSTSNDLMMKINLMHLADKMVEKGVMTDDEKRSIVGDRMTGLTEVERKNKLFDILKDTVAEDGLIFTWFIQILIDYDTRLSKSIANKLQEKYDELLRTSS